MATELPHDWHGDEFHDCAGEIGDFADTAAVMANLDLIISVTTATVHLVGGVGRPVWVLNRFDACCRWPSPDCVSAANRADAAVSTMAEKRNGGVMPRRFRSRTDW